MKRKVKDVYEPFNTLVRLVGKYGMVEVLASLAGIAQMVVESDKDERKITEAEWLRTELIRAAERTQRFNEGQPSPEDRSGQN
jgi:hypothetical protein